MFDFFTKTFLKFYTLGEMCGFTYISDQKLFGL